MDFGAGDLGYIWESDPVKRKAVAKKILPAFSNKATKSKEPIVHKWMDMFVSRMKEIGSAPHGVYMNDVRSQSPLLIPIINLWVNSGFFGSAWI